MRPSTAGMTAQQLETLCRDWPGVSGDIKWGTVLVFSVGRRMFVATPFDGSEGGRLSFKVADERFLELTDQPGIIPAPYLARVHWVSVLQPRRFATAELAAFVLVSYTLVRAQLTKQQQRELGPLPTIGVVRRASPGRRRSGDAREPE